MNYPVQASELVKLLQEDQNEWSEFAKSEFKAKDKLSFAAEKAALKLRVHKRAKRALEILDEVGEPTVGNIGADAAQAISILALHDSLPVLRKVLDSFISCFKHHRDDTYIQAIPSMTDWILILDRKPQKFGTIWLYDENKEPFLPTVEDFEHVNKRRDEYGIEPLHWPKSMTIPEAKQPWLTRPLSELIMREPTQQEYAEFSKAYTEQ